jgi:hypothetical protein
MRTAEGRTESRLTIALLSRSRNIPIQPHLPVSKKATMPVPAEKRAEASAKASMNRKKRR